MKFNLFPIIQKEFIHIRRDPRSLTIIILMPIMQLLLFGYAIDMDVKNIPLGVWDQSRTPASRELIRKFTGSGYFTLKAQIERRQDIEDYFRSRTVKAALVIPSDYAASLMRETVTPVQILIDGSDSNTGAIVTNVSQQLLAEVTWDLIGRGGAGVKAIQSPFRILPEIWYNPEQESSHFIVPGLIAVLMMMICALLTSITITREKETGTMEQILVAPLQPLELVIGKVAPYVVLASLDALLILLFGYFWFGVPFRGSAWLLTGFSLLYVLTSLSLGILISTIAPTQQVSMMMAAMITLLPSVILSGFIFPVASMPWVLQGISYIIPAKYYLIIIRGILLKGNDFAVLWRDALFLAGLSFLLLIISIRRFKVRLA
jgi:ABC-2 type transport system permease protein